MSLFLFLLRLGLRDEEEIKMREMNGPSQILRIGLIALVQCLHAHRPSIWPPEEKEEESGNTQIIIRSRRRRRRRKYRVRPFTIRNSRYSKQEEENRRQF